MMLFNCDSPRRCTQDTALLRGHVHCRYICVCVGVCLSVCGHLAIYFIHYLGMNWCFAVLYILFYVTLYYHVIIQLPCMFNLLTFDLISAYLP